MDKYNAPVFDSDSDDRPLSSFVKTRPKCSSRDFDQVYCLLVQLCWILIKLAPNCATIQGLLSTLVYPNITTMLVLFSAWNETTECP